MIQANELRIGNWILSSNVPLRINGGFISDLESSPHHSIFLSYFKPIPLTEEWLLKFGYTYYTGKTEGVLTKDYGGKLDIDFVDKIVQVKSHYEEDLLYRPLHNIKYVHQLQNLYFALTQTELEICVI